MREEALVWKKKRKAVDKRVHEEMKLLQLEEEEIISQLMGVRMKIKTNCLALYELNLYHQQVQSKAEEVEKIELKVKNYSGLKELESLLQKDLLKVREGLGKDLKEVIADAEKVREGARSFQ